MTYMDLLILALLVLRLVLRADGEETALCYIRIDNAQTLICEKPHQPLPSESCCLGHMSDIHVHVYLKEVCNSTAKCKSGHGCCTKTDKEVSTDKEDRFKSLFMSTHCFHDVSENQLPGSKGLSFVVVSYTCTNESPTFVIPLIASVAAVVIIIIIVVVVVLFKKRRPTSMSTNGQHKRTNEGSNPGRAVDNINYSMFLVEDTRNSANHLYAEIPEDTDSNKNGPTDMEEYNTVNLKSLPVTRDSNYGYGPRGIFDQNEDYDHVTPNPAHESGGNDMYAHAVHAKQRDDDGNGDVAGIYDSSASGTNAKTSGRDLPENQYDHVGQIKTQRTE